MIQIKGTKFEVEITRKKIRNLIMRVKGTTLVISAPYSLPEYKIYQFIESKRDWIYKAFLKGEYKKRNTLMYRGGDIFYVFGNPFRLVRNIGKKSVKVQGNEIYLTYKDDSDEGVKYLYSYMDKYLLNKAKEYYHKYSGILEDYGYKYVPDISARQMKSKWGVCYTRKNRINVSSYLIHYPLDCLEYIMVHEMTHFIIPNHSKRFYEICQNYMPNYKEADSKLKL